MSGVPRDCRLPFLEALTELMSQVEIKHMKTEKPDRKKPKFELEVYRQFIREASPYVSLVVGRKIHSADANLMTDDQITALAVILDSRISDLKKTDN